MLFNLVFVLIAQYIIKRILSTNQSNGPLFGVYQTEGFWYYMKFIVIFVLMQWRRLSIKVFSGSVGYGAKSHDCEEEMECAQSLPIDSPDAVDAVYFNAGNAQGDYLVLSVARRQKSLAQSISLLRIAGVGLLKHPQLPNTNLQLIEDDNSNGAKSGFCTRELKIHPLKSNHSWKLQYQGKMILTSINGVDVKEVDVVMNLTWMARHKTFDFDTDQDIWILCDAIAREPWSRQKFLELERAHQTHYEQFGDITGRVWIEDHGEFNVSMSGARDHSYGKVRRWEDLYRYGLQYITLNDGTCLALGCVSMPRCLSCLPIGYVCTSSGEVTAIRDSDFILSNLGQDGEAPTNFTINCLAAGQHYKVRVNVIDSASFFMGSGQEARIIERFARFEVNGVTGWGVSEWLYRNDGTWTWPKIDS